MNRSMSLIVFSVTLVTSIQVFAQPLSPHTESIESTVINADSVFIAKLEQVDAPEQTDAHEATNTTIFIEETLKIDIFTDERHQRMQMRMPYPASVLADWKQRACRLLVASNSDNLHATIVIDLTPGKTEVMTADIKLLRDPDAVIDAARKTVNRMPSSIKRIHTFRLDVPREVVTGTKWEPYYDTGGNLRLSVPVDQQLEKHALDVLGSNDYWRRREGARALRYFKSDENIARLRTFLNDPGSYVSHPENEPNIEQHHYWVRAEAYQTLKSWGVEVEEPVIRERKNVKE